MPLPSAPQRSHPTDPTDLPEAFDEHPDERRPLRPARQRGQVYGSAGRLQAEAGSKGDGPQAVGNTGRARVGLLLLKIQARTDLQCLYLHPFFL